MDIKAKFTKIAEQNNLNYSYQEFKDCFGGHWFVFTHSLYNESGCFSIHCIPQREEVDFYFSKEFSTNRERLCEKAINVYETESKIWGDHSKIWVFNNPFYYMSTNRTIKTLIEVIEISIEKNKEFFGVKIQP